MIDVQYPEPSFLTRKENSSTYIFDELRKKWLLVTEEEWVRQNFVQYLIKQMNYPATSIALEKEISLNELKKRFDILVYNAEYKPWLMVECKAPLVALSEAVLQQVLRYNMSVPVDFIVITNGTTTLGWKKDKGQLAPLLQLPEWQRISL